MEETTKQQPAGSDFSRVIPAAGGTRLQLTRAYLTVPSSVIRPIHHSAGHPGR
jgi:hypothetical protein